VNIPAVAEVAKEIRPLGSVLIKLRSLGAYHTPPVHPQAPGAAAVPEDFWAQLSGEQLMVGVFEDAEKVNYLLVANCDASGERKTTLTLGRKVGTIERVDKKSGRWVTLPAVHSNEGTSTRLQLLPGGGELLKVK